MATVAVIAAGSGLTLRETTIARGCDVVVAADRGYKAALAAGCRVDVVVGDFDSLTPQGVALAESHNVRVEAFPCDKDQSDLELALIEARSVSDASEIHVFGVGGGRPDHAAMNIAVLAAPTETKIPTIAYLGDTELRVVSSSIELTVEPGTGVSLLAHGGQATGVTAKGLKWALNDATLLPYVALGLSNEAVDSTVQIDVRDGTLLVFVQVDPVAH